MTHRVIIINSHVPLTSFFIDHQPTMHYFS
jgi:hypothetical protein